MSTESLESIADVEFVSDKSALESILDNSGVTLETLYPQQHNVVRQTVDGRTVTTPSAALIRRQTTASVRHPLFSSLSSCSFECFGLKCAQHDFTHTSTMQLCSCTR